MFWLFKDIEKKMDLKDLAVRNLMYRVIPHLFAEIMTQYFRMTIEGTEHIPKKGAALITPNHSGYSGFDALLLRHHINKIVERRPKILTHKLWFATERMARPMRKLGFVEASKKNGLKELENNRLLVLFPEGEYGNFKPTIKAYHLQKFKKGFLRMALEKQVPIVPTLILGAEETHINLARLKMGKFLKGAVLPLPLNVIPLPARWHIIFMDPIHLPYRKDAVANDELLDELCEDIREKMQNRLSEEVNKRKNLYF